MSDYVRVFDTTLRDGEQSPGATLTAHEKLEIARALARLGVDVIEAGFPAASPDDLAAVSAIASEFAASNAFGQSGSEPPRTTLVSGGESVPVVCALARANLGDIEKAWEAVAGAARPRIHTFLATSDIHLKHKLRMERWEVLRTVEQMVAYARSLCADVEFSPEDAGRTDRRFLHEVLETAIAAGASTLNIPDTVGYTTPDEFGDLIGGIIRSVRGVDGVIVSVHCHDDLGLATANTLAGLKAGARQAEVAVNGIGERAGNCALEEIVMALRTRAAHFGLRTGVDPSQLARVSRLVSKCTGMLVQPNKAIVGANAFAHESGIHQDGMLKHEETYEIMRPETVGAGRTELVLGKHSGRHALRARLAELGYPLDAEAIERAFVRFKTLADRKKQVSDADLEALVATERIRPPEIWALEGLQVVCGTGGPPSATVRLRGPDGRVLAAAAIGAGPVDAAYKAIDHLVCAGAALEEYRVQSVTAGIDALGEVSVRVRGGAEGRTFHGHGADTDIVVASARAYLAALNRVLAARPAQTDSRGAQAEGHAAQSGAAS